MNSFSAKLEDNSVISELIVNGENIILPWSVEFADSFGFFSLSDSGWRVEVTQESGAPTNKTLVVRLPEGRVRLNHQTKVTADRIERIATLEALKDSYLIDFVIQYRFLKDAFSEVIINDKLLTHRNTNIYYQFETDKVELIGKESSIQVRTDSSKTLDKFKQVMYARDNIKSWIVHSRLLANQKDKEIIKLNVPWYNKAIPQYLSKPILEIPGARKFLTYRGELAPYKRWMIPFRLLKPTAYPLTLLQKGEVLSLVTSINLLASANKK